jgi:hypothetical protein
MVFMSWESEDGANSTTTCVVNKLLGMCSITVVTLLFWLQLNMKAVSLDVNAEKTTHMFMCQEQNRNIKTAR